MLFVTYCFGGSQGQALIGVYKRGLRVALAARELGHEVFFFCTGREAYRDELTSRAEAHLHFVDLPFRVADPDTAGQLHQELCDGIAALRPDLIVVGEAPLAGAMLEAALCAAELALPLVILDNAYNPSFAAFFAGACGPIADGLVLAGPSSYHATEAPAHVCQVPPFIDSDAAAARALLSGALGLTGQRLVTILAYDDKVEALGRSLLARLEDGDVEALFLARAPERCQREVDRLPEALRRRVRVLPPPSDSLLFGLLECSRLAIVKYGFMQVSECMALRTPAVVVYHEGPRWLDTLPEVCQPFTHVTDSAEADPATLAAARRLLDMDREALHGVHTGELGAAMQATRFLVQVAARPLRDTTAEACNLGFTVEHLLAALRNLEFPRTGVGPVRSVRALHLRRAPGFVLHAAHCEYLVGTERRSARLWIRRYESAEALRAELSSVPGSQRRVLYASPEEPLVIELDVGQSLLPLL